MKALIALLLLSISTPSFAVGYLVVEKFGIVSHREMTVEGSPGTAFYTFTTSNISRSVLFKCDHYAENGTIDFIIDWEVAYQFELDELQCYEWVEYLEGVMNSPKYPCISYRVNEFEIPSVGMGEVTDANDCKL